MVKFYHDVLDRGTLLQVRKLLDQPCWGYGYWSTNKEQVIWGFDPSQTKKFIPLFENIFSDFDIVNVHCNGQTIGQQASLHTDDANGVTHTFVFFPDEWQYADGGRLHVFNSDVPTVVTPSANFGVLFSADLRHYAEAPTTNRLRRSVGLKMRKIQ